MKKYILGALLILVSIAGTDAFAQTAVTGVVRWTNPTTATDNSPLTSVYAIQKIQIFAGSAPLNVGATAPPLVPYAELLVPAGSPAPTTYTYPSIAPGASVYVRIRACNLNGCSNYSAEVSKTNVTTTAKPNVVTNPSIQ